MSKATPPDLPSQEVSVQASPGGALEPLALNIGPATLTSREGNRFTFTGVESHARVRLTILAPDLARVDFLPEWVSEPPRSWAVAKDEADWPEVPIDVAEE